MIGVARLGDTSSHNGSIITASTTVTANGIGIARNGDLHSCPILGHGITPITGTGSAKVNNLNIVIIGDMAGCGAIINIGSSTVKD